jgi:hypothetical protein
MAILFPPGNGLEAGAQERKEILGIGSAAVGGEKRRETIGLESRWWLKEVRRGDEADLDS